MPRKCGSGFTQVPSFGGSPVTRPSLSAEPSSRASPVREKGAASVGDHDATTASRSDPSQLSELPRDQLHWVPTIAATGVIRVPAGVAGWPERVGGRHPARRSYAVQSRGYASFESGRIRLMPRRRTSRHPVRTHSLAGRPGHRPVAVPAQARLASQGRRRPGPPRLHRRAGRAAHRLGGQRAHRPGQALRPETDARAGVTGSAGRGPGRLCCLAAASPSRPAR